MDIQKVYRVFFSPTRSTAKVVEYISKIWFQESETVDITGMNAENISGHFAKKDLAELREFADIIEEKLSECSVIPNAEWNLRPGMSCGSHFRRQSAADGSEKVHILYALCLGVSDERMKSRQIGT